MPKNFTVPNFYDTYRIANQNQNTFNVGNLLASKARQPKAHPLIQAVETLLGGEKFSIYSYEQPLNQNADGSVTATILTQNQEKIGDITFTINHDEKEIKAKYSNDILERVFQPLFVNQNYFIDPSLQNTDRVIQREAKLGEFYASDTSLQFAAGLEKIRGFYEGIKARTPALQNLGEQKLLEQDFWGNIRENAKILGEHNLSEAEKIIAGMNQIAQRGFFTIPPDAIPQILAFNPANEVDLAILDQRLDVLGCLEKILQAYSNNEVPDKNTINEFRNAVDKLSEDEHHSTYKTQRILSGIGMGIGISAFIASFVILAFFFTPGALIAITIGALFLVGGLMGCFGLMGFISSFPQGIAKSLNFVADQMEKLAELAPDSEQTKVELGADQKEREELSKNLSQTPTLLPRVAQNPANTEKAEKVRTALKNACEGLEEEQKEHLFSELETQLNYPGCNFKLLKKDIKEANGDYELLCQMIGATQKNRVTDEGMQNSS